MEKFLFERKSPVIFSRRWTFGLFDPENILRFHPDINMLLGSAYMHSVVLF